MTEGARAVELLGSTILLLGVGRTRWFSMLTVTFWKQLSKHLNSRCRVKCDLSIPSKSSVEPAYGGSGPGNATRSGQVSFITRPKSRIMSLRATRQLGLTNTPEVSTGLNLATLE